MVDTTEHTNRSNCECDHLQQDAEAILDMLKTLGFTPVQTSSKTCAKPETAPVPDDDITRLQHYRNNLADAYDAISTLAWNTFMDGDHDINSLTHSLLTRIGDADGAIDARIRRMQTQKETDREA